DYSGSLERTFTECQPDVRPVQRHLGSSRPVWRIPMSRDGVVRFLVVGGLSLLPTVVRAQAVTTGSIAGVVRDTSGAVLPGISVEAASPALIEKVRTAVTDGEGRYTVVDLRPGMYTVNFTLAGFSTVRREGITISAGFAATVNADMRVGALEET